MDATTRKYINNLAQQVIATYNIEIPITDINKVVKSIGGSICKKTGFDDLCDGTIKNLGKTVLRLLCRSINPATERFLQWLTNWGICFFTWVLEPTSRSGSNRTMPFIRALDPLYRKVKPTSLPVHY